MTSILTPVIRQSTTAQAVVQNPSHGQDGWTLEDMDWNPETGWSKFTYEKVTPEGVQESIVWRAQPSLLRHQGWWERDRTVRVFGLTDRDWMRWERGTLVTEDEEVSDNEY